MGLLEARFIAPGQPSGVLIHEPVARGAIGLNFPLVEMHSQLCSVGTMHGVLYVRNSPDVRPYDIQKELSATPQGVNPEKIKQFLTRHAIPFRETFNGTIADISRNISKGRVSIVAIQALDSEYEGYHVLPNTAEQELLVRYDAGHYSTVIGLDSRYVWMADSHADRDITTNDGLNIPSGLRRMTHELFMRRWIDQSDTGIIYSRWSLAIPLA